MDGSRRGKGSSRGDGSLAPALTPGLGSGMRVAGARVQAAPRGLPVVCSVATVDRGVTPRTGGGPPCSESVALTAGTPVA